MFQGCRSKCHGHAMIVISRNPGTWLPPGPFPFPNQGSISFSFQQITQFAQFLYQRLDPIGFFNPQVSTPRNRNGIRRIQQATANDWTRSGISTKS